MKAYIGLKRTVQPQKYTLHIDMCRTPSATEPTKSGIYNAAKNFKDEKEQHQYTIIDCKNNCVIADYVQ